MSAEVQTQINLLEDVIRFAPLGISIFALIISGLTFYFNNYYDPKKLFLVPTIDIKAHTHREFRFYIVNGSKSDIVILSASLSMRLPDSKGYLGSPNSYLSCKQETYRIKSNESIEFIAHFPENFNDSELSNFSLNEKGEKVIDYNFRLKWFSPSAKLHESNTSLFSIMVNEENKFCGIEWKKENETNLYSVKGI